MGPLNSPSVVEDIVDEGGRAIMAVVGLPTDCRGLLIVGGPILLSLRSAFEPMVKEDGRSIFARGVAPSMLDGVSPRGRMSEGRGVMPKMDVSRGPFRVGAGVAPPVPLTPSFRLIYNEGLEHS